MLQDNVFSESRHTTTTTSFQKLDCRLITITYFNGPDKLNAKVSDHAAANHAPIPATMRVKMLNRTIWSTKRARIHRNYAKIKKSREKFKTRKKSVK
jgi:hypothetical protein